MNLPGIIPAWLRRLVTQPGGEMTRWQRGLRFFVDLVRHCASELRHDKAGQMAAALTYHTLFSMLPTIVLAMVVLHAFVTKEHQQQFTETVVELIMPEAQLSETIAEKDRDEFYRARAALEENIAGLTQRVSEFNVGGIGMVGLLVFIWGATALLETVERNFNTIFAAPSGRPWYFRLPMYYTIITLAPLVLVIAQVIQAKMFGLLQSDPWTAWATAPAAIVLPLFAMWLLFFLLYILVPNTTVPKHSAAVGAFVAALAWFAAKEAFRFYVSHAAVASFYAGLAVLPLFLFWLWLSWVMVLFGLELTYTLSAMQGRRLKSEAHKEHEDQVIDPAWMVPLAVRIADAFRKGQTRSIEDLANAMNLTRRAIRKMIDALIESQIVLRVQMGPDVLDRFSLARPADAITVEEVLNAGEKLLPMRRPADEQAFAWKFVKELHELSHSHAANITLADLTDRTRAPSPRSELLEAQARLD